MKMTRLPRGPNSNDRNDTSLTDNRHKDYKTIILYQYLTITMKSKSAHKPQSIATFISSLANLVSFSPLLTPLLTVDTTSIKTLNEIY